MSAANPEINYEKLFVAIDEMDTEGFLQLLSSDCVFRFGSAPAVQGHEAIRTAVDGFFASIVGLEHDVHRVIDDGNGIACEGEVTYTRHDGDRVTLPFCDIFETDSGLISVYRIYMDIGPLYAE